jgi:DNA mismatch repair protein MutS
MGKSKNGIILTGVSYAGKSSFMRSIGLAIVMAHCGFYVYSEEFTYYPFNKLLTKIALQDNLFKNKSTFIAEMSELNIMLESGDRNTMIISDEPCIGADYESSVSLVGASIIKFIENNSCFMMTTHFHKLANLPQIKDLLKVKFYNMKVSVRNGQQYFDHILVEGPCDQTQYGVEIASYLKLDREFINNAFSIRNELDDRENLELKQSRYNKDFFLGSCSICNSQDELHCHHIVYQEDFKKENNIKYDKDSKFNLCALCRKCHIKVHQNKIIINGYKEESDGIKLNYEIL